MSLRSKLSQLCLICLLTLLSSCVEYRIRRSGQPDHYLGWAHTRKNLDPKLGSKGKFYFIDRGDVRPYLGGNFRRNNLRFNVGVIYYSNDDVSLELGWRKSLFDVNILDDHRIQTIDPFRDAEDIIYIGGVIKW